jgi:diaminopimelate epimerase
MIINFTKMHGLGNDFVVIDLITQGARLQKLQIQRIADRKFGIGCDQVILITPPNRGDADFFYRIYNSDGKEVEQCGNGARCAAKFFIDNGLSNKTKLIADCLGGSITLNLIDNGQVEVNLGTNYTEVISHPLNNSDLPKEIYSVATGNPHGVCIVDNLDRTPVAKWGQLLTKHPIFPNEANIGFMKIINRDHIELRVYERGIGPTLACGSAACAAVLVGRNLNLLDNRVKVSFEHGDLIISINPTDKTLNMTGPANSVYIGRFRI